VVATVAAFAERSFGFGLLILAFWLGFRHGIDWDHIAAITDITSSQQERRRSLLFGTLYATGHALVVFAIGVIAIVAGQNLPESVDEALTRVVGVTLLLLGVYVFYSLIRHGRDFRLRSRWMLVFSGVRRGVRWARRRAETARTAPQQAVGASSISTLEGPPSDGEEDVDPALWHHGHHGRLGHHHHQRPEPDDTFMNYGKVTAFTVGMIHGIGGETPTQVVIFASAAHAGHSLAGVVVLAVFLLGLFASNSLITLGSAFGFMSATRNFSIYATVAVITGFFSLVVGMLFVFNKTSVLPALFGG
jgi:cytochrome c biogenesis protein CcdA